MRRILVVGVGNPLYGDDAYGSLLARSLINCNAPLNVLDAEHNLLGVIGQLTEYDILVFIDVCNEELTGNDGPSVYKFKGKEIDSKTVEAIEGKRGDAHRVSPLEILVLLASTGVFRGEAYLLCVRPERIEFGSPLSTGIVQQTSKVLDLLLKLLSSLGQNIELDFQCVENAVLRFSSSRDLR